MPDNSYELIEDRPVSRFVRFLTADRLELQGVYFSAADPGAPAAVHIHGLDGNFYENRFIDALAATYHRHGLAFLTFNNRGHDYISDIIVENEDGSSGYRQLGGMYETLEECVPDIRAAVGWLAGRGHERVILQGHSHGALKAVHYLHATGDPAVTGLVLLSPSDDFALIRRELGPRFDTGREIASEMVAAGRGRELMPAGYYSYPTSAGTWHDCFRSDSVGLIFNLARTDREGFPELNAVRMPVLLVVGTEQEAFTLPPADFVDRAGTALVNAVSFHGAVIEGAPHNYLGCEDELAAVVDRWLADTGKGWR